MTRKQKPDLPEEDDGRTIANMNVEGMPWYTPPKPEGAPESRSGEKLSREETRYATWGALKAALLVVGVICGGIVLFIWFCVAVWFR